MSEEGIEIIRRKHQEYAIKLQQYERNQLGDFVTRNVGHWFVDTERDDIIYKILPSDRFQFCNVLRVEFNAYRNYEISIIHSIDVLSVRRIGSDDKNLKVANFSAFLKHLEGVL